MMSCFVVIKVLRDDDFWNALDSISGVNWPIFAVRLLSMGSYKIPFYGSNCSHYMVPLGMSQMKIFQSCMILD